MNSDQTKTPLLVLGAKAIPAKSIKNFFNRIDNKLLGLITNPPYLRYMGWNMLTLSKAEIRNGEYWEISNGPIKTLRFFKDSTFIAACFANNNFLGWGRSSEEFDETPIINSLALTEYVYEFVELYRNILLEINDIRQVIFRFHLTNTKTSLGKSLLLSKNEINDPFYSIGHGLGELNSKEDITYTFNIEVNHEKNMYDSEKVAHQLLSSIYTYANISPDELPYTTINEVNEKVVDIKKILNQN